MSGPGHQGPSASGPWLAFDSLCMGSGWRGARVLPSARLPTSTLLPTTSLPVCPEQRLPEDSLGQDIQSRVSLRTVSASGVFEALVGTGYSARLSQEPAGTGPEVRASGKSQGSSRVSGERTGCGVRVCSVFTMYCLSLILAIFLFLKLTISEINSLLQLSLISVSVVSLSTCL